MESFFFFSCSHDVNAKRVIKIDYVRLGPEHNQRDRNPVLALSKD
jgi:hypothetical protein